MFSWPGFGNLISWPQDLLQKTNNHFVSGNCLCYSWPMPLVPSLKCNHTDIFMPDDSVIFPVTKKQDATNTGSVTKNGL